MRERITISIQKELLDKLDHQIDGSRIRNRSHAIEHCINETLGNSGVPEAVILGGGKFALKLIPLIEESILMIKDYGIQTVYLAVGYLGPKIKEYFGDGNKFGIKIIYLEGGEGTAGAIKPLKKILTKSFLVFNLDSKIELDLARLYDFHKKHFSAATIATLNLANPKGVYLFEPEVFQYIPEGFSMLESDVFPKLNNENKLLTFPILR
jgi:NDP-sugar pyrophosphorylase family protein